jgi:hypothetical protein
MMPGEAYLILQTYSAPVHKYILKYAIRYKIADFRDLALTIIKNCHALNSLSVHLPGSKCFGIKVHLVELHKEEHSSGTAIFQRKAEL